MHVEVEREAVVAGLYGLNYEDIYLIIAELIDAVGDSEFDRGLAEIVLSTYKEQN